MSTLSNAPTTVDPEDLRRVTNIAAAILQRDEAPAILAARIVNYLRADLGIDTIDLELLQALRQESAA